MIEIEIELSTVITIASLVLFGIALLGVIVVAFDKDGRYFGNSTDDWNTEPTLSPFDDGADNHNGDINKKV